MRSWLTYTKHALLHPYNMPLLVLAIATGLISGSFVLLLAAIFAELAMLGIVPRLHAFRRHVDDVYEQGERMDAAKTRAALLLQMDDAHRDELERIQYGRDKERGSVEGRTNELEERVKHLAGPNRAVRQE